MVIKNGGVGYGLRYFDDYEKV